MKLEELEAATGISSSALGSYENDKNNNKEINHGSLLKLAKFYGVSVDYILCLTENREQANTPLTELHLNDEMVAAAGAVAPVIASGIARRASRTGPGAGPGPEDRAGPGEPDQDQGPAPDQTSRAGPARPAPPRPPARPGQGQTRTRPAVPDHQTAPAQDSTHTRTGANQNRARGRRYSLGTPRRLRVRERRIFLGMKNFFRLPPR